MTALLRKDFYVTGKRNLLVMVLILSFTFTPQFEFIGFAYLLVLSMSLSQSVIAYDERCRWDIFAAMLPLRPQEIVCSKYVYSILSVFCVWGLTCAVNLVWMTINGGDADLTRKLLLLALVLLLNAAFLTVIYRFGTKRSQTVMMTAVAVIGVLVIAVGLDDGEGTAAVAAERLLERMQAVPTVLLGLGAAAAAAAANIVSYHLSVRFYLNRRAGLYD